MKITSYNHHAKAPSFPASFVLNFRLPGSIQPSLLSNQYHGSRANTGGGIKSIDIAIAGTDVDDSLISAIFVFLFFFPPGVMKSFLTMRNWKLMGAYVGVS
jgi:hypothetical protein